jgi:hypothetical protein
VKDWTVWRRGRSGSRAAACETRAVRRLVAPAFALIVVAVVLFGFAVVGAVGQAVSDGPARPPWQAFALPGVLSLLAAVLVGGTILQTFRNRRR